MTQFQKSLNKLLFEYKQYANGTSEIYTLNFYDDEILRELENNKSQNSDIDSYYQRIKDGLAHHHFDSARHIELFSIYSEAEIFLLLKKRLGHIEKISESKSNKTPDFKCKINIDADEVTFCLELKTFGLYQSKYHMDDIQNEALDDNINIEDDVKKLRESGSSGIVFNEREYSPLKRDSNDKPIYTAIASIIEKMEQNYKSGQYQSGLTIPIYNLSLLSLPLIKEDISPILHDGNNLRSGILWNAAFGNIGNIIYGWERFEGSGNIECRQSKDGFLNEHNDIPACIFFNRSWHKKMFWGLYNTGAEESHLQDIISEITDGNYNCQKNCNTHLS